MKKALALVLALSLLLGMSSVAFAEVVSEESGVLKMYGPGLFAAVGENGTIDVISGAERPGYNVLVERWRELYPNIELVIDPIPWDNWKAAIQTAALSNEYDIIIHGNGNADFCLDMTDILAATPNLSDNLNFYPLRRNPENMTETKKYGISYSANPTAAVIDLQILKEFGVEVPTNAWTWNDMLTIAKTCTGVNPVTGEQNYGLSMIGASNAQKNYIILSRAFDNVIFDFSEKLADCKFNFNTPKTAEVLNFWKELGQYQSPDYAEGLDTVNAYTDSNNIAIVWAEDLFTQYNKIVANGCEDRYMFLELPVIEQGPHKGLTSSNMADLNICIYKNTEQKELATKFFEFLVTDPIIAQWLIDTCSIPNNPAFVGQIKMPAQYLDAINRIIATAPADYNSSASQWYDSTWFGSLQSDIVAQSDQLLKGSITAEEMAAYIQGTVDSYLASLK